MSTDTESHVPPQTHQQKRKKKRSGKKEKSEPKLFSSEWKFDIPGQENMEKIGQHVMHEKINVRSLLYYPWTDFFVRPTVMMLGRSDTDVCPKQWIHSLKLLDVYMTLEILALQFINSGTDRWQSYLRRDQIRVDSLDPEVDLIKKIDEMYITSHKAMLEHRTQAVDRYRNMRSFAKMLKGEVAVDFMEGMAATTLADWIKATELFFHTMIVLNEIVSKFLSTRKHRHEANSNPKAFAVYENSLKIMEEELAKPTLTNEQLAAPWYKHVMYNELVSKGLLTASISVAPQAAMTEDMEAELVKTSKNVMNILENLDKGIVKQQLGAAGNQQTEELGASELVDKLKAATLQEGISAGPLTQETSELATHDHGDSDDDSDDSDDSASDAQSSEEVVHDESKEEEVMLTSIPETAEHDDAEDLVMVPAVGSEQDSTEVSEQI